MVMTWYEVSDTRALQKGVDNIRSSVGVNGAQPLASLVNGVLLDHIYGGWQCFPYFIVYQFLSLLFSSALYSDSGRIGG